MGKDEAATKKRRKLNTPIEPAKQVPVDVYKKVVEFEESEAQLRSAVKDAVLYKKMCQDLRKIFSNIEQLKEKNTKEAKDQITSLRVEASLLIVTLKKLNRLEKVRTRSGREALHKEKQRVDSTHLLLQNLLYEADHLDKEVTKCLQFKSKDEEIELISLSEFYETAPSEISRREVTEKNKHELQLARLEWELRQRRELAGACNEVVASKERVCAAIAAAKSRLDALSPHLKDVLKSTKPLQECLALKLDEKHDEARAASLLPTPLFMLYANAKAYSDALGTKFVTVSISGDEDEAKRLDQSASMNPQLDLSESESDQENNDDDQPEKKKRHHRTTKVSKEERAEAKKRNILRKHPLNLQLSVTIEDGTGLNLVFFYLINLKIVVVKHTVILPKATVGISAGDVLVLNSLYPGDPGDFSPHPATTFLLSSAGISGDFQQFIPELGRPYIWAQRMCGLDFMPTSVSEVLTKNANPSQSLSVVTVENVILTLKRRLKARVELMKELQNLETGRILNCNPCVKLSGCLTQWQSVDWCEYRQSPSTSFLLEEGAVRKEDMLYRAIITRQSAKLVALVALKSEYPSKAPIFSLMLHWNGAFHAGNDDDIRDIERIVNTLQDDKNGRKFSLSAQMTKLLMCFDILLEAVGPSEFTPDRVMLKTVRGRSRSKPFKFLKKGSGLFLQY